jgi:GMP synthase (glutamine-hydrolysing)
MVPALRSVGVPIETVRTDAGQLPPESLRGYSAYVSMGGDMFVSDASRYRFIDIERRLFDEAVASEIPAVGICLGAQILASALGARVSRERGPQIGWDRVRFDSGGDTITAPLAPDSVLFEWHMESFELPRSAVLLGTSDAIPVQAFRAGSAWAFQFHIEAEARHIHAWSGSPGGRRELEATRSPDPARAKQFSNRLGHQAALAEEVFARFARLAADRERRLMKLAPVGGNDR